MPDDMTLFGRIALSNGWIDEDALGRCLKAQRAQSGKKRLELGKIMVREGLLTAEQVEEALAAQRRMRESHVIKGYELLTPEEASSYLNKLVLYKDGWLYYHPLLLQNLIAYEWILNAEPIVEVPDAVVVTTKKDIVVKYNGPLSVQVGPLDYNITLPPIVAKDIMPRVEKTPLVWGVVGGFAGGVIITLLLSALL